jgi:hypothetical protein
VSGCPRLAMTSMLLFLNYFLLYSLISLLLCWFLAPLFPPLFFSRSFHPGNSEKVQANMLPLPSEAILKIVMHFPGIHYTELSIVEWL